MRILNVCFQDYAGLAFRLTEAINRHSQHQSRQLTMKKHNLGYAYDILTKNPAKIGKWIRWADIVNCWGQLTPLNVSKEKSKKLIITHRGTLFRRNPKNRRKLAAKFHAKELVCTPDLSKYCGEMEWLPNAVPVEEWSKLRRKHRGKPIVCQTPSRPRDKNTAEIVKILAKKKNIRLLIVTKTSWKECMRKKSVADIYVGPFKIGYGLSMLEAWAMGIPVISLLRGEDKKRILYEVGYLPHYNVSLKKLSAAVDALLGNKKLYREYVKRGRRYVKTFHDYPVVAKRFISFCEKL